MPKIWKIVEEYSREAQTLDIIERGQRFCSKYKIIYYNRDDTGNTYMPIRIEDHIWIQVVYKPVPPSKDV